jgi:predicted nuclease of predicted toxin-antitoxin system
LKLLFDENLSPRLTDAFASEFPGSSHVTSIGLGGAPDLAIWEHAKANDFIVISKDDDFRSLSLVNGAPPKVIWMRVGNASTAEIEKFIRSSILRINNFEMSPEESLLIL